jgi:hypothetical protein
MLGWVAKRTGYFAICDLLLPLSLIWWGEAPERHDPVTSVDGDL